MRSYIELYVKPGRRALIALDTIDAIFTSEGHDCTTIAPPDRPVTILLKSGFEFETYGISPAAIMVAMKTFGKIDGWIPLP
jgi:hypothetical protein